MRKINGVPVEAHTDLSSLTGGEVLKWDADNSRMAWEDQDATGYVPVSWYGGRGVFGGDHNSANVLQYITIGSAGNATDFGDMTQGRKRPGGTSNGTRGVIAGDIGTGGNGDIDYFTISTTGNATSFGDLTDDRDRLASACSDGTRAVFHPGYHTGYGDTMDYITIMTTGNATLFGDGQANAFNNAGWNDSTRGIISNGQVAAGNGRTNVIEYYTIQTTGNSQDFGDTTAGSISQRAAAGDTTRMVIGGGEQYLNAMDYITIQTTGNSTDFGDLTIGRQEVAACSDATTGVWAAGWSSGTHNNVMDYVTIQTTGNAADFGDLLSAVNAMGGLSGD